MTTLSIQLVDTDYKRLKKAAEKSDKSIQALIYEWIAKLPEIEDTYDVTQDPVFQMDGYNSDAPSDLSVNLDKYIYGEKN